MTSSGPQILDSDSADRAEKDAAHTQLEDLWRGVLGNPRIGIALAGSDGRFLATNAKYQDLVGYSQEELGSMSFLDVTEPGDREENRRVRGFRVAGPRPQRQGRRHPAPHNRPDREHLPRPVSGENGIAGQGELIQYGTRHRLFGEGP